MSGVLVAVGALAILMILATWRARDAYGASRKLPPGSLSFRGSLEALTDPAFYARAAAHHGPVFKMSQFHRPVVCIADLPLGLGVLESQREELRPPAQPFWRQSPVQLIAFLDDEHHVRHRPLLRTVLTGDVMDRSRDSLAEIIAAELRYAAADSSGGDLDPRPLLERVTYASVCHVLFGWRAGDPRIVAARPLITSRHFDDRTLARAVNLVRSSGTMPDDHSVLAALLRDDPRHLDDDTLLGNLAIIARVTRGNVRGVLAWTLKELIDHPEVCHGLRTAAANVDTLATHVVQETMRLHQSEFICSEVTGDVQVGDYRVPRGWLIRVCVRECHDNPAIFPEPQAFNPARFAGRRYDRTEYFPFTDGTHSAAGANLTVMVARTFVTVLATQWDCRKTSDGPVERDGNRHWNHWGPSTKLRVRLTERIASPPD